MFVLRPASHSPSVRAVRMVVLLFAMVALTACAGDAGDPGATQTASNGDTFNDADVAFATDMIPHHAQAIQMVNMTMGRDLDPKVQQLADQIRSDQATEVEQMVDWLTAWDRKIPRTAIDHGNAHKKGGAEMHHEMPGMMSPERMDSLESASSGDFEDKWLQMMIEHHQGAIDMAQTEQENGVFAPALELAKDIEATQKREIEIMRGLLDS